MRKENWKKKKVLVLGKLESNHTVSRKKNEENGH